MDELLRGVKRRGEEGEASLRKLLEEREKENSKLRAVVEEYKNNSEGLKVRSSVFRGVVDGRLVGIMLHSNSLNSRRLRRVSCGISRIVARGYLRYGLVANGQVVELEISLDEIREQYNNVLKANNNRSQQKKMAFLERNLEQLTNVQRGVLPQPPPPKKPFLCRC
jgi:kinesin family protein 5